MLLAAAFLFYFLFFGFLIRRPVTMYSDEPVHLSTVRMHQLKSKNPYMFAYQMVRHALHRKIMLLVGEGNIILKGRIVNFVAIIVHCIAMILFLSRYYEFGTAAAATAWWMLCGWGLGPHVLRLANFTERAIGDVLLFLGFAVFTLAEGQPLIVQIGATAAFWSLLWHSSKFGVQALIFVGLMLFIMIGNWQMLLSIAASFILSLAIFGKEVWLQLTDQLAHLRWYARYGHFFLTAHGNKLSGVWGRRIERLYNSVLSRHLLLYLPLCLPVVIAWLIISPPDGSLLRTEALACLAVGAITVIGRLAVTGPGGRYIYILLPVIFADLLAHAPTLAYGFLAADAVYGTAAGILFAWWDRRRRPDWADALEDLRGVVEPIARLSINVCTDPLRISEMIFAATEQVNCKLPNFGFQNGNMEFVVRFYPRYPNLTSDGADITRLVNDHEINAFVFDKASSPNKIVGFLQEIDFRVVKEGKRFVLLKREGSSELAPGAG